MSIPMLAIAGALIPAGAAAAAYTTVAWAYWCEMRHLPRPLRPVRRPRDRRTAACRTPFGGMPKG